jgi:AcrR family transcriptional regulator
MITGTERTVYLIKKGIIDLLKVKSLKQITVNNICEQAMIGRLTFYNHYQDKYEVLEEMNKNFIEKLDGFLQERFLLEDIETILTAH